MEGILKSQCRLWFVLAIELYKVIIAPSNKIGFEPNFSFSDVFLCCEQAFSPFFFVKLPVFGSFWQTNDENNWTDFQRITSEYAYL